MRHARSRADRAVTWGPRPGDGVPVRQGVLFDHRAPVLGAVPRARTDDPLTSHEAAARVPEFSNDHYARILAALLAHGDGTCWDIAEWTGIDHVGVARRMKELETQGRVLRVGEKAGPNGRGCTLWRYLK